MNLADLEMINFKRTIPSLPVANIGKAVDFYEAKMGFRAKHKEGTFAIVTRGPIEIHLWASCDNSWKFRSLFLFLRPIWSGAESFLSGTANCRVQVEGINELYVEYMEQGILHKEHPTIQEQYWGDRDLAISDLYGNLITFYEEIG